MFRFNEHCWFCISLQICQNKECPTFIFSSDIYIHVQNLQQEQLIIYILIRTTSTPMTPNKAPATAWPVLKPEDNEGKCQNIYWNLVEAMEARGDLGVVTIKELRHTARCDNYHDLSKLRSLIEKDMGTDSLSKIINGTHEQRDVENANSALFHYWSWTKQEVRKGLNTQNLIYYHTMFHWEKWAAGTTIFGAAGGLYKALKKAGKAKSGGKTSEIKG